MGDQESNAAPSLAYIYVLDKKAELDTQSTDIATKGFTRVESNQHASCPGRETNGNGLRREEEPQQQPAARYTAALLKSTLLLMGCKPRVAHKVSLANTRRGQLFLVGAPRVQEQKGRSLSTEVSMDGTKVVKASSFHVPQASKSLFESMAKKLRGAAADDGYDTTKATIDATAGSNGTKDMLHSKDGLIWTHALQILNLDGRVGVLPGRLVHCLRCVG